MNNRLQQLTETLIDLARQAGADAADAMAVDDISVSIDVRGQALEQAERSEGLEIGLRVLIGQRQACVSASDISDQTMAQMAERAVAMAREAPEDPGVGLADPSQLAKNWDIDALELSDPASEPSAADLEDKARQAEAAALAVQGISQTQGASASYYRSNAFMAATNGFAGGFGRTRSSVTCIAITGSGTEMERDYASESRIFASDVPDPRDIGHLAGQRAAARSGARKAKTGAYPVLFDERIAAGLIGHLLVAINGSSIARGSSWARDLLHEPVLPAHLSLIEDPHRPRIFGSRPVDGEGLPTQRRAIVENGMLTGWTLDLATGRKLDMPSTANAARGVGTPPSPSVSNVTLTAGPLSKEQMMRDMGTGLLVTSLIGSSINPNTGDYSRGASGFWIEGGVPTYPVNEITIAGNLREMLRSLQPADDAQSHLSRVVPSLLVEGLTLAGE